MYEIIVEGRGMYASVAIDPQLEPEHVQILRSEPITNHASYAFQPFEGKSAVEYDREPGEQAEAIYEKFLYTSHQIAGVLRRNGIDVKVTESKYLDSPF
jgi:hypothetical protein